MTRFATRARGIRSSRFARLWLGSDLIGIPFTLLAAAVLLGAFLVFSVVGNLGGIFFALFGALLLGGLVFLKGGKGPETMAGVKASPEDGAHRVLVIANLGLEEPALCSEVCARGDRGDTEAMIIAPVTSSRLQTLTDDNGAQLKVAQGRVAVALETLEREGISAGGHAAMGEPMSSLLDGLRQFDANEVVMLDGGETGWKDASRFAERVRSEVGLRVTEISPPREPAREKPGA